VIATGGGTFTFEENIQFIQSEGLSVYLSAPYALLRSRIGDKAAERPLFRDDLATHELYTSRIRYYRMSDVTLEIRKKRRPQRSWSACCSNCRKASSTQRKKVARRTW